MPLGVELDEVKRKLKFDYMRSRNDPGAKVLDGFVSLLSRSYRKETPIMDFAQEVANHIHKQFRLRWVMIGLRSHSDGLYRYEIQTGMREEAWRWQKKKTYKLEDFGISPTYVKDDISKLSRVYLEEDNPLYGQDENVVNRPVLLRLKRQTPDETLEADFLDTLIYGPGDDLLGWIEYSGTTLGKFPDSMTIRYIEVIAAILAAAMAMRK